MAISIKSAKTVFDNLDRKRFSPTRVLIDKKEWTAYDNEGRYPIDKNDFSYVKNGIKFNFDYAFIVIHGTPGEDGKLQGYLDMVKYPTTHLLQQLWLLLFKFFCNQFLKNFGINVAEAVIIEAGKQLNIDEIMKQFPFRALLNPLMQGVALGFPK